MCTGTHIICTCVVRVVLEHIVLRKKGTHTTVVLQQLRKVLPSARGYTTYMLVMCNYTRVSGGNALRLPYGILYFIASYYTCNNAYFGKGVLT